MLPVPFILLFIPKILEFLSKFKIFRPITDWLHRTADKHSKRVLKSKETDEGYEALTDSPVNAANEQNEALTDSPDVAEAQAQAKRKQGLMTPAIFTALMLFVALPIPGTGAWSGALVASLFSLSRKHSFLAILLGVIICGVIMTLASYGILGFLSFLV